MTAEFDDEEVVVRAARRALEGAWAGPPAGDGPTDQAARAWWAVVASGPAGAACEHWFDGAFRLTCRFYPAFRDRRDEFWQEAQLDLVRRLAARVREEGGIDAVTGPGFGAWVRRQFHYCCQNLARREVRRGRRETVNAGPGDWGTVPDHRSDTPDGRADGLAAALQDCLSRLPLEQRVVVGLMVESPGISYRAIAARLGALSVGTVSNRFHAARDQLKNCLAAKGVA